MDEYLSDYDYYKVWPINSWSRIWINDKLTLKYMLYGTEYNDFMPQYYFYSASDGLKMLMDVPPMEGNINTQFLELLKRVKEYACKPNNGTESRGFVRLSYENACFCINGEAKSESEILKFIEENPNYIFTEYLRPSYEFERYSKQIHTLRVVTINQNGYNPQIVFGYLRFPNDTSGEANYNILDVKEKYNLYTYVDLENGKFLNSIKVYVDHVVPTDIHPDTGIELKGFLPGYANLKERILGIAKLFSNLEYMGFDIGVTKAGYKIMEINSHPGISATQIAVPMYSNPILKKYFKGKIATIDNLSEENKKKRNLIER